eukprot:4712636-Alexandrium_andersonii.AAC.1
MPARSRPQTQTAAQRGRKSAASCTKRRCAIAPNPLQPKNCGLPRRPPRPQTRAACQPGWECRP